MYKFNEKRLRVCQDAFASKGVKAAFKETRFILLQHLLSDTEEFIEAMIKSGLDVHSLVVKPYSIDLEVKKRIEKSDFILIHEEYEKLEKTKILDELIIDALEKSKIDNKTILIVDVGGYFVAPLLRIRHSETHNIAGIVEVTKFGHIRYKNKINELSYPVISIAESRIKTLEGRFVGMSAVTALDKILRDFGLSISGRRALVVGFGLIGKSVAAALKARNLPVKVYDKDGFPQAEAFTLGYIVGDKDELLSRADLILSSTATRAISFEDILKCKDGCIIGSVGSKQNEIDVEGLENNKISKKKIHPYVTKYKLKNKTIYLLKNGEAINFIVQSCPDEIIDLIFAETLYCWKHLIEEPLLFAKGSLHLTPIDTTHMISDKWLELVGIKANKSN